MNNIEKEQWEAEHEPEGIAGFPDDEELVITRVERLKSREARYCITFGTYSLTVLEDVMIKYRMTKGNSFVKRDLEKIVVEDERQRIYVQSLRYLEHKQRTRRELARKLQQKQFEVTLIEDVLDQLEREKLVDDQWFAKEWTRQRMTGQRKGKLWIRQELRQKGVSNDLIAEALQEVSVHDEFETALLAGRKKWKQLKGDISEKKRKTFPFLVRRGFPMDMVRRVVNVLIEEDGETDNEEHESLLWD